MNQMTALALVSAALAAALSVPGSRRQHRDAQAAPAPRGSAPLTHRAPVLRIVATAAAASGSVALLGGWVGALIAGPAAAATWWATGRLESPAERRRREQLAASVPLVVDLMAACLAVGLSPAAAVAQISAAVDPPAAGELGALVNRLRLGVDPVTVWRELATHPQLGGLGRSMARAMESGASVADAMQRLAGDLRRRSRADVEKRARAVGVRAAIPLGVCLLPAFVLVGVVPLVAGSVSVLLG
jgi:Flp pilus assembly protein TadB